MGRNNRTAELTLLAKVDQQQVKRSIEYLRRLRTESEGVSDADQRLTQSLDRVSKATQQNVNAVRQSIAVARTDAEDRLRLVRGLKNEADAREQVAKAATRQAASAARAPQSSSAPNRFESAGDVSTGLSAIGSVLPGGAGDAVRTLGDLAGAIEHLPRLSEGLRGLTGAAGTAVPVIGGMTATIGSLAVAVPIAGVALAAMALAIKKFADELNRQKELLGAAIEGQLTYFEVVNTGTAESIEASLKELEVRRTIQSQQLEFLQQQLESLGAIGRLLGGSEFKERARELEVQLAETQATIDAYRQALGSSEVKARDAAEATKKQAEASQQQATQEQQTTQVTRTATQAETQRTQAIQQTTQALQSTNQQIRDILTTLPARLEAVRAQFRDRLIALRDQTAAIQKESQERQVEILRDAQREQAEAVRRGEYEIAKMRARAIVDQFELALDRNFSGLARSRREAAMNESEARADLAFEEQERRLQTEQRLGDLQVEIARQLLDVEIQRRDLMIELARAEAEARRQFIIDLLRARGFNVPNSPTNRASGGPLAAGQSSWVNERSRESFMTGGREILLPAGLGVFTPAQAGTVNPTPGGVNVHLQIGSYNDQRTMARIAGQKVEQALMELGK